MAQESQAKQSHCGKFRIISEQDFQEILRTPAALVKTSSCPLRGSSYKGLGSENEGSGRLLAMFGLCSRRLQAHWQTDFLPTIITKEPASPQGLQDVCLLNSFILAHMCMVDDYSGNEVCWKNKIDGSVKTALIFVGVLCHSGLIFCTATNGQTRED